MSHAELEAGLLALLKGEHSSLTLSFNDRNGPNYMSVREWLEGGGPGDEPDDWVSLAERQKAIDTNRMWTLHWYQDSPVGFYSISASALPVLLQHVLSGEWQRT